MKDNLKDSVIEFAQLVVDEEELINKIINEVVDNYVIGMDDEFHELISQLKQVFEAQASEIEDAKEHALYWALKNEQNVKKLNAIREVSVKGKAGKITYMQGIQEIENIIGE